MIDSPSKWEHLRADFEADAERLGFNLDREEHPISSEAFCEYQSGRTGLIWRGFVKGYELALRRLTPWSEPPPTLIDLSVIGQGPSIETNEG